MNLLEYEAKQILSKFSVSIPDGIVIRPHDTVPSSPIVLKSQVHSGGRGKAGGVQVIRSGETLAAAQNIFSLPITGETPLTILAEELLAITHEYYLSIVINRTDASLELIAHHEGGVEVESQSDSELFRCTLSHNTLTQTAHALAEYYGIEQLSSTLSDLLAHLVACFTESDATLLEINPLVLTDDNQLVAGDCKMILDDDAAFRHPEWKFEQMPMDRNFVVLDTNGTVATIANGAGLAMATVDAVHSAGLVPANFLDIGGGATPEGIIESFRTIVAFPHINAIIINIFGGIVRCDDVARAIIAARKQFPSLPTLYIRLSGTNSQEAAELLRAEHLSLYPDLHACIKEIAHG